jgi:tetratricopeptide (TPR) repeat protein
MIVRDESARLPACLASVAGLVGEVVVVDTGSQDDTVAVARQAGAKVIEAPWAGDFSAARNLALAAAKGRWILVLDADESWPAVHATALRRLVAQPARRAYNLIQRSMVPGGHTLDVRIVRLFPREVRGHAVQFERPIHEQVNTSLERLGVPIEDSDLWFDHGGYATAAAMPAKAARNQAILARALEEDTTGDPHLRLFYAATFFDAGDFARAAAEYDRCVARCGVARPKLANMARLKTAECWFRAGDLAAMRSALDALPPEVATTHPLASALRVEEEAAAGRPQEGMRWLEVLLGAAETAYLPPVALGPLRARALSVIAEAWAAAGDRRQALGLMRAAVAGGRGECANARAEVVRMVRLATLPG